MTRTVRSSRHYKRPPGKRKPVVLEVPAIVRAGKPRGTARTQPETPGTQPAMPTTIVTARTPRPPAKSLPPGLLPDTPEEHQRRGDAGDALWRELVRRVREDR